MMPTWPRVWKHSLSVGLVRVCVVIPLVVLLYACLLIAEEACLHVLHSPTKKQHDPGSQQLQTGCTMSSSIMTALCTAITGKPTEIADANGFKSAAQSFASPIFDGLGRALLSTSASAPDELESYEGPCLQALATIC